MNRQGVILNAKAWSSYSPTKTAGTERAYAHVYAEATTLIFLVGTDA